MAAAKWQHDSRVSRRLTEEPFRFDLFQAVRLLEQSGQLKASGGARSRPVGYQFDPSDEVVRFRGAVSLSFPASTVHRLQRGTTNGYEMEVTCLGLAADGVLPQHYATLLLTRLRQRDFSLRDFLDLFNHRLISLFYRAWEKYRFPMQYERVRPTAAQAQDRVLRLSVAADLTQELAALAEQIERHRRFNRSRPDPDEGLRPQLERAGECTTQLEAMGLAGNDTSSIVREIRRLREQLSSPYDLDTPFNYGLYCLAGLGHSGLRGRMDFTDEAVLYYGSHFATRPRNATCLQAMITDYFAVPTKVLQFKGNWLLLDEADQSRLPTEGRPKGLNCGLGSTLVIGQRVWDVESTFTVQLGPLDYTQFQTYLPSGDAMKPLRQMIRFYVGPQFTFEVQLILQAQHVPPTQLGAADAPASRLGWDTWLHGGDFLHDAMDSVFSYEG